MKKNILLLVIGVLTLGCSSPERDCCTIIDTRVSIKYVNVAGENLFELDNALSETDITIYHKINNEWIKYYEGNLDSPKGISIVEREDGAYLVVSPSTNIVENNYSETKIQFSGSDSDILRTEIERSNSNEIVKKVWYNDELKWDSIQIERMFEIIKQL